MSESTKHDAIYLQVCDDDEDPWCGEVTWCQDRIHAEDVKYIRTDLVEARIRKAVEAECAEAQNQIMMLREALIRSIERMCFAEPWSASEADIEFAKKHFPQPPTCPV